MLAHLGASQVGFINSLLNRRKLRAAFTLNRTIVVRAMLFAIGAVAAYLPVIIATMRGKVIESYGLSVPGMPLQGVAEHVVMVVRSDLWLFVGAAASIIVMSSVAGRFGYPNRSAYSTSKWGLIGFTKTLSRDSSTPASSSCGPRNATGGCAC